MITHEKTAEEIDQSTCRIDSVGGSQHHIPIVEDDPVLSLMPHLCAAEGHRCKEGAQETVEAAQRISSSLKCSPFFFPIPGYMEMFARVLKTVGTLSDASLLFEFLELRYYRNRIKYIHGYNVALPEEAAAEPSVIRLATQEMQLLAQKAEEPDSFLHQDLPPEIRIPFLEASLDDLLRETADDSWIAPELVSVILKEEVDDE